MVFSGPVRTQRQSGRGWWKWALLLAVLAGALFFGRGVWLRKLGEFLILAEEPQRADVAIVLAGDWSGSRVLRAVELARQGYVKQIVVDGPRGQYDTNEAELAVAFAVRRGASQEVFIPLPMWVSSTIAEARIVDAEMRRRQIRRALVVTSSYHTRRARDVFRRLGSPGLEYRVIAADSKDFAPDGWWRTRDGKKIVFQEYTKLLYWWLVERP